MKVERQGRLLRKQSVGESSACLKELPKHGFLRHGMDINLILFLKPLKFINITQSSDPSANRSKSIHEVF